MYSKVIAGLGNPGREYEGTRHNVGFLFLDVLFEELTVRGASGSWRQRGEAEVAEVRSGAERLLLIKPLSFMNRSGEVVAPLLGFYKVAVGDLVVVHDDADLQLGRIHLKLGGGDGGHNGIKSISQLLGSKDFIRMRLGIGRPDLAVESEQAKADLVPWVLGRFGEDELDGLTGMLRKGVQGIELLCKEGLTKAQNRINRGE